LFDVTEAPASATDQIYPDRAAGDQSVGQTRQQPFHRPAAADQQAMRMPALRNPAPSTAGVTGRLIPLDDHHLVEVTGQHTSAEQPGQTATEDECPAP
jgi:hypothetical protein